MTRIDEVLRIRRHEPTRPGGCGDVSHAFAVTGLVVAFGSATASVRDTLQAWPGILAFAACFLRSAPIGTAP